MLIPKIRMANRRLRMRWVQVSVIALAIGVVAPFEGDEGYIAEETERLRTGL